MLEFRDCPVRWDTLGTDPKEYASALTSSATLWHSLDDYTRELVTQFRVQDIDRVVASNGSPTLLRQRWPRFLSLANKVGDAKRY